MIKKIIKILSVLLVLLSHPAFAADSSTFTFGRDQGIAQIKPEKPVKIKLKRTEKGSYEWEVTGDRVQDVMEADKRLREYLMIK